MNVECAVLAIGSELLEGSVLDTNSFYLCRHLSGLGFKPACVKMVPDDAEILAAALSEAASKYRIIFTTGGLGPTFDDITAECCARAAGVKTVLNERAYSHMADRLNRAGVRIRRTHKRQAMLPENADLFENYSGTALGFGVKIGGSYCVSMPGVPYEMKEMFEKSVVPFLLEKYALTPRASLDLHFAAVPESDVDEAVNSSGVPEGTECIINAGKGEVVVKLRGGEEKALKSFGEKLSALFPVNFIGYGDASPAKCLVESLSSLKATVAFAESCTGGLLSKLITDVPGASEVFAGGVVSYSNEAKERLLGVSSETLSKYGAVSEETAREMARGALRIFDADCAVSVTGIAGPGGGSAEKPVGTVHVCAAYKNEERTFKFLFGGDREAVRTRTASAALFALIKLLKES